MARFTDFNEFLDNKETLRKTTLTLHGQKIQESRKNLDLFIKDILKIVKDYYEEVVSPRAQMHLILKKDEKILSKLKKTDNTKPFYTYLINFVPKALLPLSFDLNYAMVSYLTPGQVTSSDWHIMVALQFEVSLFEDKNSAGNLLPSIFMKVWGKIKENNANIVNSDLKISYKTAWRHTYTEILLKISEDSLFQKRLEQVFMFLTPNVLNHKGEIFGFA